MIGPTDGLLSLIITFRFWPLSIWTVQILEKNLNTCKRCSPYFFLFFFLFSLSFLIFFFFLSFFLILVSVFSFSLTFFYVSFENDLRTLVVILTFFSNGYKNRLYQDIFSIPFQTRSKLIGI